MKQPIRMEVLALLMHMVLSVLILAGYIYTIAIGKPDETLRNILMMTGGYWFGVAGSQLFKKTIQQVITPPTKAIQPTAANQEGVDRANAFK